MADRVVGVDDLLREAREQLDRVSPEQARAAVAAGALIVDIRSERQRETHGVVPGAHVVPRNVLEWRADRASPHRDEVLAAADGPLVIMCQEGYQSSLAAATLLRLGREATDIEGGFEAWRDAGLPVAPADAAAGGGPEPGA